MFQYGGGDTCVQRDGRFTKTDAAIDVDFLGNHVKAGKGTGQPAALHQNVALFRLDNVVGGEGIRSKLGIGTGDSCGGC